MKIVICGSYVSNRHGNIHEKPITNALENIGHQVKSFRVFNNRERYTSFEIKLAIKYQLGRYAKDINKEFIEFIKEEKPDSIFLYNCPWIFVRSLKKVKAYCGKIMVYCNDDPFSKNKYIYNRNIRGSYKIADQIYTYRPKNISDIKNYYNKSSKLLLPSFDIENFKEFSDFKKLERNFSNRKYDICFIGHFEKDNRLKFLTEIIKTNKKILIAGDDKWIKLLAGLNKKYVNLDVKGFLSSRSYAKLIANSKSALCFFSHINSDILTRRVFEVPATATYLIAPNSSLIDQELGKSNYISFNSLDELKLRIRNLNNYFKDLRIINEAHKIVWKKHNSEARYSIVNNDLAR